MTRTVRPLDASPWAAFERNNGLFGGSWCLGFHPERAQREAELPGIKHRRAYDEDAPPRPDWRLTCVFVGKKHRGRGVARMAVAGALDLNARTGGGLVEAVSEATAGRDAPGRFLFTGTVELFEELGFARGRPLGTHAWLVSRVVQA